MSEDGGVFARETCTSLVQLYLWHPIIYKVYDDRGLIPLVRSQSLSLSVAIESYPAPFAFPTRSPGPARPVAT